MYLCASAVNQFCMKVRLDVRRAQTKAARRNGWASDSIKFATHKEWRASERAEGDVVIIIIEYIPVAVRVVDKGRMEAPHREGGNAIPPPHVHTLNASLSLCVCRSQYCTRLIHVCNPQQGQSRHPAAHSITRDIRVAQPAAPILITRAHKKLFAHFLHLSASISGLLFAPSNFSTRGFYAGWESWGASFLAI